MQQTRIIFFHKHPTSARLRFLRLAYHSVCAFDPLPSLSMLMDEGDDRRIIVHPAAIVRDAQQRLGLCEGALEAEAEFRAHVDVAGGVVNVVLLRFTDIDPPFDLAKRLDACFIDLPDARDLTDVELQLLRRAYEVVIGG